MKTDLIKTDLFDKTDPNNYTRLSRAI